MRNLGFVIGHNLETLYPFFLVHRALPTNVALWQLGSQPQHTYADDTAVPKSRCPPRRAEGVCLERERRLREAEEARPY